MLDKVLDDVDRVSSALIACTGKTGQNIRDNEWLMSIRGRTIIPGGACEFDLPISRLAKNTTEKRFADITAWFAPIARYLMRSMWSYAFCGNPAQQAKSLRKLVVISRCYRGKVYQLLRVNVARETGAIPEISANKYMLWIRFMSQDGDMKPKAFEGDIAFDLTLCNF
jgi:cell division protein ZapD